MFRQEDVPVSLGLVIDNSGSMRDKRLQVNAAALTFVKTSNPQDEAFVVNFNDDYYLDTIHDFTNDITEMKDALERIDARGSTALYDAVIGSLDHLKKGVKDKKVLLVVTDGVDNASRRTLENAVQEAQRSDALIYAIGLFSDEDLKHNRGEMKKARRALTTMASATGGLSFFPENVDDTESICAQIARDIRNQYTLAYYPTNAATRRHVPRRASGHRSPTRLRKTIGAHPRRLLRPRRDADARLRKLRPGYQGPVFRSGRIFRDSQVYSASEINRGFVHQDCIARKIAQLLQLRQKTLPVFERPAEIFRDGLPHVGKGRAHAKIGVRRTMRLQHPRQPDATAREARRPIARRPDPSGTIAADDMPGWARTRASGR